MNKNQIQFYQLESRRYGVVKQPTNSDSHEPEEVAPGIPIVRSNTPRPLSFESMMSSSGNLQRLQNTDSVPPFPAKAPSAPPLPEEIEARNTEEEEAAKLVDDTQNLIWMFEYGLEMDPTILNSAERLAGQASLYGPAVLKGYSIKLGEQNIHGSNGPTIIALVSSTEPDLEVWGVLYHIPQRLIEHSEVEPSLLDTIHAAIEPQKFFKRVQVTVYETYREREVQCITYVATDIASAQLQLVAVEQWSGDTMFLHRLAAIASKQKLPSSYISQYEVEVHEDVQERPRLMPLPPPATMLPPSLPATSQGSSAHMLPHPIEQNTEPLPIFAEQTDDEGTATVVPTAQVVPAVTHRWLIVFAIYLLILLLIVLIFSVLQGLGAIGSQLTANFTPLSVPWLVMIYGLLGGCISCLVTLGHLRPTNPPLFVLITWFTRPFVGAVLAILAYLLLNSGFFAFGEQTGQHMALFLLVSAIAGFGEGWIFVKRS